MAQTGLVYTYILYIFGFKLEFALQVTLFERKNITNALNNNNTRTIKILYNTKYFGILCPTFTGITFFGNKKHTNKH